MISKNEINENARKFGVPVSTIERDYAQNWLLKSFSSMNMALKGGTGIRKAYISNYRFSDDLDFTLLEEQSKDKMEMLIKSCVKRAKEESGINFNEDISIKENINGLEVGTFFRIMRTEGNTTKIKLDMTKFNNEKILLPLNAKNIIHLYSDNLEAKVMVYALEEIVTEKIRSLFQRTRPRDLYDVGYLWSKCEPDKEKVLKILDEKFKFKGEKIDMGNIEKFERRKENFKNAWKNSLQHQIKELPDFDDVFEYVKGEMIKFLIALNS